MHYREKLSLDDIFYDAQTQIARAPTIVCVNNQLERFVFPVSLS